MKFSLLLILVAAFSLNACTTLANRRDLYSPTQASGPYTDMLAQHNMVEISDANAHLKLHEQLH